MEATLLWKRMKGNIKIAVKDGTESTKDEVWCLGVAGWGWGALLLAKSNFLVKSPLPGVKLSPA